ncbi:hypothetical protein QUC31_007214 [Theobroma cacao]
MASSSHQKSLQDESHLEAGQQQWSEITPASTSAAVEGADGFHSVKVEPGASGLKQKNTPASRDAFIHILGQGQSEGNKNVITQAVEGAEFQSVAVEPSASAMIVPTEVVHLEAVALWHHPSK